MTNEGRFVWFEYVPMPDGAYTMIAADDGNTIGGYTDAPTGVPAGASWRPYLLVGDAAASTAKVKTLGGSVMKPPFQVGDFATMAVVGDPHGASFALWQPAKAEDAPAPAVGHFTSCGTSSRRRIPPRR